MYAMWWWCKGFDKRQVVFSLLQWAYTIHDLSDSPGETLTRGGNLVPLLECIYMQ